MFRIIQTISVVLAVFSAPSTLLAQVDNAPYWPPADADAAPAHPEIESHEDLVAAFLAGDLSLDDVRRKGLSVFSTPFNTFDGMGDGPFDPGEQNTRAFGERPTLQGNRLILRTNGLDAQSCNECHSVVSNNTRPPVLGLGGAGGVVQMAIIMPSLIDVADSSDDRTAFQAGHEPDLPMEFDGVADYNGRVSNPPFLFGGGGVELLGKEMTEDLQGHLEVARTSAAGTIVSLDTHGVNFGTLVSEGGGSVDFSNVVGVDDDLVVKPFGRKGENFSMRDFGRGAMQFHFGVQPVELVGEGVDGDGDGVVDEVTVGEMTALHFFSVANPRPFEDPDGAGGSDGLAVFRRIGCADCHVPSIEARARAVPLAHPEVPDDPGANVYAEIDLVGVGFEAKPNKGVDVPLFADLKRHDMGDALAETFEHGQVSNREFTTARLWGVADTAPYLHDGRATTLYQAIWFHGGEAQAARDEFVNELSELQQQKLLDFLGSLRTPDAPNEELLPLE